MVFEIYNYPDRLIARDGKLVEFPVSLGDISVTLSPSSSAFP